MTAAIPYQGAQIPMVGAGTIPMPRFDTVTEDERPLNDDAFERRAILAVRGGDPSAYDYLVTKYMRRVLSIAWGFVRNAADAEDLAQDAFVRAFETMDRFQVGQPFGPWVCRIVTNRSLDLLKHRKRIRHEELSPDARAERRDDAEIPAMNSEIAMRIDRALQSLPEMQQIVARFYLVEELSHGEIALILDLNEGTVRSHLSIARRKLQEMLYDLHGESR